jgi:redox-sensitive bicupin YhaK (pirin superfamily)
MKKSIIKKVQVQFEQAFPGFTSVNVMANEFPIEPVLAFTEYHMKHPVFGPHPHAGVSVMTYMSPESPQGFINRDSLGDFSHIEPGGLHVSQAGSGLFHDEFPEKTGVDAHGFQIWINHKETDRWVEPRSFHVDSKDIQEVFTDDFRLRILQGEFDGKQAPFKMVTDISMFHVFLDANRSIEFEAEEMAFVYGLKGNATIDSMELVDHTLVNFSEKGNKVVVNGGSNQFEFMFVTATPIREPIVYGGPFVMTTAEQMQKTRNRLAKIKWENYSH